ncbi:hypothetical protein [Halobacteriovorax sp. DA5]|nr:hypothetical protein [Halobacteriovorax sp. DA5]
MKDGEFRFRPESKDELKKDMIELIFNLWELWLLVIVLIIVFIRFLI